MDYLSLPVQLLDLIEKLDAKRTSTLPVRLRDLANRIEIASAFPYRADSMQLLLDAADYIERFEAVCGHEGDQRNFLHPSEVQE